MANVFLRKYLEYLNSITVEQALTLYEKQGIRLLLSNGRVMGTLFMVGGI